MYWKRFLSSVSEFESVCIVGPNGGGKDNFFKVDSWIVAAEFGNH